MPRPGGGTPSSPTGEVLLLFSDLAMPAELDDGIRGVGRRDKEPIKGEWSVVALNPSSSAALLARVAGEGGSEFDFGITHELSV